MLYLCFFKYNKKKQIHFSKLDFSERKATKSGQFKKIILIKTKNLFIANTEIVLATNNKNILKKQSIRWFHKGFFYNSIFYCVRRCALPPITTCGPV